MAINRINVGQELLNVPMGTMIREMAKAIAEAQWELDKSSMTVAELMSGQRLLRDLDTGQLLDEDDNPSKTPRMVDSRVYFGYTYEEVTPAVPAVKDTDGTVTTPPVPAVMKREPNRVSMMELGFTPTFYQFVDTIIEVKIAIKITEESTETKTESKGEQIDENVDSNRTTYSASGTWGWWRGYNVNRAWENTKTQRNTVQTSQVDATYATKYSYSVEGASLLRTKLTPVPPPAILLERIREVMEEEKNYKQRIENNEVNEIP